MTDNEVCIFHSEKTIGSIEDYIAFIRCIKSKWNVNTIWYRGQRLKTRVLEPNLYRSDKWNNKITDSYKKQMELYGIAQLEYNMSLDYLDEIKEFKMALKKEMNSHPDYNDFHYMFIGQHYQLRTPALDWSTDPLVGLYFALNRCIKYNSSSPIVFLIDPVMVNKYYAFANVGGKTIDGVLNIDNLSNADEWIEESFRNPNNFKGALCVTTDKELCPRMSRQSGCFTLLGPIQPLNYPWIQTYIEKENRALGTSVLIDPDSIPQIITDLDLLGVNENTIFGKDGDKMDNMCKKIVNDMEKR